MRSRRFSRAEYLRGTTGAKRRLERLGFQKATLAAAVVRQSANHLLAARMRRIPHHASIGAQCFQLALQESVAIDERIWRELQRSAWQSPVRRRKYFRVVKTRAPDTRPAL